MYQTKHSVEFIQQDSGDFSTVFSVQEKQHMLDLVYSTGDSSNIDVSYEVFLVAWRGGEKQAWAYAYTGTLGENIIDARQQLLTQLGVDDLNAYKIHLHVLGPWQVWGTGYVPGLHAVKGVYMNQHIAYRSSYVIETNRRATYIREKMCTQQNQSKSCHQGDNFHKYYAPSIHIGTARDSQHMQERYRGKLLEPGITQLDISYIQDIINPAQSRLIDNLREEGLFTYVYNPSSGNYSNNNNMIRQLMGSRLLAELSQEDPTLLTLHKKNLEYIFDHWYEEEEDIGYIIYNDKSKLGAIAMALRTLVASPYFNMYISKVNKLGQALLSLQNIDGSFHAWYKASQYKSDEDYLLTFYSGESIIAFIELYEKTKNKKRLDAAILSQDFYLQRYVEEIGTWYYPAYVPRHTMSLYKLYHITRDVRYASAIFILNDKLIDEMLHTDTTGLQDIIGRFYADNFKKYGNPHSASDGIYTEGLVYAYMLAHELGDSTHQKKYQDALITAIYNLAQLQYRVGDVYFLHYPERVIGALRYRADDNRIRIDTTQHALDALRVLYTFLMSG